MNRFLRNTLIIVLFFSILISIFSFKRPIGENKFPVNVKVSTNFIPVVVEEKRILSPRILSSLFPDEYMSQIKDGIADITIEKSEKVNDHVISNEWVYVAEIRQSDVTTYYFKNSRNSRILSLSGNRDDDSWSLIAINLNDFILKSEQKYYKVMKK
jgi:hypothetical protein